MYNTYNKDAWQQQTVVLVGHANRIQRQISYRTGLISSIAGYKQDASRLSGRQDLHLKTFLDHLSQHVNSLYRSEKTLLL